MVFMHPTILRDVETADYYSRGKYDDLRTAQLGLFESDELSNRKAPKLPDLHLFFDGQRVNDGKEGLETIVPTSELGLPDQNKNAEIPQLRNLKPQAGANDAVGSPEMTN